MRLNNQFGEDASYPAFLPQGGVGMSGPMPGDSIEGGSAFTGAMGWDREAYSTVFVDPAQLDGAFMSANGAALDEKLSKYSDADRSKILADLGELGVLNTDAKKIDATINPPPPKKAPAKKAPKSD